MNGARAVMAHDFGPPETLRLELCDPGAPGPGEVRIQVHAAGVSFVDVLVAAGEYQLKPPLPFIPGSEFAGVIEAVGSGVPRCRLGERVCAVGFGAAFSETALVKAKLALPIPHAMDFATAAVFRVSYATAYHALVQRARLKPGETVLVLGAGGALGYAAVEIAKALSARVIGSASSEAKRSLALRGGASAVIDSGSPTWREDLRVAAGGKAVDVVVDPVGGAATEAAFRALGWNGRHLVIGFAGGAIANLPVNLALLKGAALIGVDIRRFGEIEPVVAGENLQTLFRLYRAGQLSPVVAQSYPLDAFVEAMKTARAGQTAGRIVLTMPAADTGDSKR